MALEQMSKPAEAAMERELAMMDSAME